MGPIGRAAEIGALRVVLDRPHASVTVVTGVRGVGKTAVVLEAVRGIPHLYHRVPPLPEPHQWAALERCVRQGAATRDRTPEPLASRSPPGRFAPPPRPWDRILGSLVELASARLPPLVLVLDDAHHLSESRAQWSSSLSAAVSEARSEGRPLHVVVVGDPGTAVPLDADVETPHIHVGPLPFRPALRWMPGRSPEDRVRAYAVFGGIPGHLEHLDPTASLATNIRRLFLERGAPLENLGLDALERHVQSPPRYAAILAALAGGDADWKRIHEAIPDLTGSGQLAPYIRKLDEMGWVRAHRSLDAAPRSRSRRYRLTDPSVSFWYRLILPHRAELALDAPQDFLTRRVRPHVDAHAAAIFPDICRQYMTADAAEALGSWARECGGLWAADYEVEVAGVLRSGIPFYGTPWWSDRPLDVDALHRLDAAVSGTRYGFGRELRLRILFSRSGYTPALTRQAARRDDVRLLGPADLVGEE